MFKSKQFPYFGRDNEFIYFNIDRLQVLEDLMGGEPITDIMADGKKLKTLGFLSRAIAVGLGHVRHNFSTADALKELGTAITVNRHKVADIAETIQYSIYQSGIMGEWHEKFGDAKNEEERLELLKEFKDFFPEIAKLVQGEPEVQEEATEQTEQPKKKKKK